MRRLLKRLGELFAEEMRSSLAAQHSGVSQMDQLWGLTSEDEESRLGPR